MSWIFEHTEVATIVALVIVPLSMMGLIMFLASGDAPEVSDLQGAPETLGDFPPMQYLNELGLKHFPAGAYVIVSDDDHIELATEETHNAVSYGNGKYLKVK